MSRADLVQQITSISRHCSSWTALADKRLHFLMSYVKTTLELEQKGYVAQGAAATTVVDLYVDADLAGDISSARSTSGGILRLTDVASGSHLVTDWWSKRQTATARSTAAAEIVSMAVGIDGYSLPTASLLESVLERPIMTIVHEDNMAALLVAKRGYSPALRAAQKHFRVAISALGEVFAGPDHTIIHCPTLEQRADPMTKGLSAVAQQEAWALLDLYFTK